jgi:hypothetical protein
MNRLAILLVGLLAAGLATAIVTINRDGVPEGECVAGKCLVVVDDDGASALGVLSEDRRIPSWRWSLCTLVVRHEATAGSVGYVAKFAVATGEVFFLDGALGTLRACEGDLGGGRAVIDLNPPAYAWATPHDGAVPIPFGDRGELTTLDDYSTAAAQVARDGRGDPVQGRFCVFATPPGPAMRPEDGRHCGVKIGDTFAWGAHRAEIVRIVPPASRVAGWIEVALR